MGGGKILAAVCVLAAGAGAAKAAPTLTVAAAANVRPALEEIREAFEHRTGARVVVSYGASGILARQIEQGAPFDVFLSADARFLASPSIDASTREPFAVGNLVLVSARGRPALDSVAGLAGPAFARIAVAKPEIAPYGRAAMEALSRSGVLPAIRARLVFAESVRDALRYVETGDADAGFAAESEARETALARRAVAPELYAPIVQEAAIVARSSRRKEAAAFLEFLRGPEAGAIWARHGYRRP